MMKELAGDLAKGISGCDLDYGPNGCLNMGTHMPSPSTVQAMGALNPTTSGDKAVPGNIPSKSKENGIG